MVTAIKKDKMSPLYKLDNQPKVHSSAFVAPNACLIGAVSVEADASIWFNTVVRADINSIYIGQGTNIQDGCMLHVTHSLSLTVGERVTVGHGAILHGCHIEADCLVAMGAIVLDGARIGAHSIVSAGSLVTPGTQVPPGSLVMGVPAKVVRQVKPGDREMIERGAANYIGYKELYKQKLEEV